MHVLIGIPEQTPYKYEQFLQRMIDACCGEHTQTVICRNAESFRRQYYSHPVDLVLALDDLRMGRQYSAPKRIGSEKYILIVPDACHADAILLDLIRDGYYNILTQKDLCLAQIRELVRQNRTLEEALTYCGVDFRPVRSGQVQNREKPQHEKENEKACSIRRKYLGDGIGLIQLLGKDADALSGTKARKEEYDLERFTGYGLTQEELSAKMPVKTYPLEPEWVDECKDRLKDRFVKAGLLLFNGISESYSDDEIRKRVFAELAHMQITGKNAETVYASFLRDIRSYGRIDQLIHDAEVSDVRMMDYQTVNVQSKGQWYRTNIRFRSQKEYETYIQHICNKNNVPFNWAAADVVFPDEKSFPGECMLRNAFTNSNLNVSRTMSGHIRITRKIKKMAEDLIRDDFLSKPEASLLANYARRKKSMLICGGSGSGKTVLLNCLLEYFPRDICGEMVQESSELFAPNHLNIKSSNAIEGKGGDIRVEHNLKSLAEKALLRNTDVFIIGEIKSDEAADFVTASRTTTVYATIHSDNCFGAIPRCAELAQAARSNVTKEEIISVLARTIDVVVYCDHYQVIQIAEVKGYEEREHDIRYVLYDFDAKEGEWK